MLCSISANILPIYLTALSELRASQNQLHALYPLPAKHLPEQKNEKAIQDRLHFPPPKLKTKSSLPDYSEILQKLYNLRIEKTFDEQAVPDLIARNQLEKDFISQVLESLLLIYKENNAATASAHVRDLYILFCRYKHRFLWLWHSKRLSGKHH